MVLELYSKKVFNLTKLRKVTFYNFVYDVDCYLFKKES